MAYNNIHVDRFYLDNHGDLKLDTQNEYTFLYIRSPDCPGCKKFNPQFNKIVESLRDLNPMLAFKVHTLMQSSKLLAMAAQSSTKITVVPYLILFKGRDIFTIFDVSRETDNSIISQVRNLIGNERGIYSRHIYQNPPSSFVYPPRENKYESFEPMDMRSPYSAPSTHEISHKKFVPQSPIGMHKINNVKFDDEKHLPTWSQFPVHKNASLYGTSQKQETFY